MKINKVKFVQNGFKGIAISYEDVTEKDNMKFNDIYNVGHTAPVHKELRKAMQRLKYHVLRVYKLATPELEEFMDKKSFCLNVVADGAKNFNSYAKAKSLMESVEITSVSTKGESFLITAKMRTLGELTVIMNTPLIDENADYPYFDSVMENIIEIHNEVEDYIGNRKEIDDAQLVMEFYTSKNNAEKLEEIKSFSPEQLKAEAVQLLENLGAIVILSDEQGSVVDQPVMAVVSTDDSEWDEEAL